MVGLMMINGLYELILYLMMMILIDKWPTIPQVEFDWLSNDDDINLMD